MTDDLRRRTIANISVTATSKVIALVFQAAANVILSWTLSSADYGVVGFAWVFINFLSQFNDMGLDGAAVQKGELDSSTLSTGFTLKLLLGACLFSIALALAPLTQYFFADGAVVGVIRLLSINFVIGSLSFVPSTVLLRALDYRKIAIANTCSTAVNSFLSILLALLGFGYWSIVAGSLAGSMTITLILNVFKPSRLRLRINGKDARELIRYGRGLFASRLIMFSLFNADTLIIGTVMGSTALGYYTLAFQWGSMVSTLMSAVVHSVLFPTLARIQEDKVRLRSAYLVALRYVSLVGILTNVMLFVVAGPFLFHILGHGSGKWLPALGTFRILAIYGIVRVVLEPLGPLLMAVGRTELLLLGTVTAAFIELVMLYPSIRLFGIEGVAASVTCAYAVQYLVYYPYLKRRFDISARDVLRGVGPAAGSGMLLVLASYVYDHFLGIQGGIMDSAYRVLMCGGVYIVFYAVLTGGNLMREVRTMIGRGDGGGL